MKVTQKHCECKRQAESLMEAAELVLDRGIYRPVFKNQVPVPIRVPLKPQFTQASEISDSLCGATMDSFPFKSYKYIKLSKIAERLFVLKFWTSGIKYYHELHGDII